MNEKVPWHPEEDVMAAFVEGRLAPAEQQEVVAHLRGCDDCRTVIGETARFERETAGAPRRSRAVWLAAAAAAAAILLAVPLIQWMQSRRAPIRQLVASAPRTHRTVEARLSDFPWARLQSPVRGVAPRDPEDLELNGAAGKVLRRTAEANDSESQHAAGVAYLLTEQDRESIVALQQAAAKSSDPRVWNDLAAARYVVALRGKRFSELPEALVAADRALRLDPKLPDALFNRALILEALGLQDAARHAWQSYLDADPSSGWSVEAREHLTRLSQQSRRFDPAMLLRASGASLAELVRTFPQDMRTRGEGSLLASWADAVFAHDDAVAATILAQVHAIGATLAATNGEHLLSDAAGAIDRSGSAGRAALVDAYRLYRDSRIAYANRDLREAESGFRRAAALFRDGGSPMADVALYYAASAAIDQNRIDDGVAELHAMRSRIDASRNPALAGEIQWSLALAATLQGDWNTAMREAAAGADLFRKLGERANAVAVLSFHAQALDALGDRDRAWSSRIEALAGSNAFRRSAILHGAVYLEAAQDRTAEALSLVRLMIEDGGNDNPSIRPLAYAEAARLAIRNGDRALADTSLADARRAQSQIRDATLRQTIGAQVDISEAMLARDPHIAIATLDRVLAFFTAARIANVLPDAYLERARAWQRAGNDVAARTDYESAWNAIDQQSATVHDPALRLAMLDTAGQVAEETIQLELSRGRAGAAFAAADRAHGGGAIGDRMPPPSTPTIEYAVLPDRVVAFCSAGPDLTVGQIPIDRRVLGEQAEALARAIRTREPIAVVQHQAAALYAILIAPLRPHLAGATELVIVPDRQLESVPFAALYDASRGHYLIEDFPLRIAPAANAAASPADAELKPALVVADAHNAAPALPASAGEAAGVAAEYGAATLTGNDATRARFLDAAPRASLIHYAGHADSDASSQGALLLTASGDDDGLLTAADIARRPLPRHPLVVLAACGTLRGGLGRAFLLAGARSVIGTLWEMEDDASASFFLRFHQYVRAGLPSARALQSTQLERLHSSDPRQRHPQAWCPVELLGNS